MAFRSLSALLLFASALPAQQPAPKRKVLFLTHSAGYVHEVVKRKHADSLSLAERQLMQFAKGEFDIVATQDCGALNPRALKQYAVVVFYTSGELPIKGRVLLDYVRRGGGFVGIHCATDTLYGFGDYGEMIGGYFNGHPWHQKVGVEVEVKGHPATKHLGPRFEITDEIYQFRNWDRKSVQVLLSLDTATVDLAKYGVRRKDKDFALAWCRKYGRGRVFYTALGHRPEVWKDPRFLAHLVGGIQWASQGGAKRDEAGFVTLLDRKNRSGWKQAGPGGFVIDEDGVATARGGMGLYYYEETYRNFTLKLEFRQKEIWSNSGVFVRFPRVDGDPWNPVKEGHEIQIYGDKAAKNGSGSVYTVAAPTKVPLRPAGEWNQYEITCVGPYYWVRLNGELIVDGYKSDRSLAGMVGIQNHNANGKGEVSFRNIKIRELPDDATSYHVLFDGTSRQGWKMCGPGGFTLKDGFLESSGGMGMLWHEREFTNFRLMLEWQVGRAQDNSGVFVRFPDPKNDPWIAVNQGYELQICDLADASHRTGSVYSFRGSTEVPTKPIGQWNHYEIEVIGQRYRIFINNKLVNTFTGTRTAKGHIGLQNHDPASKVRFRNIRVIEIHRR